MDSKKDKHRSNGRSGTNKAIGYRKRKQQADLMGLMMRRELLEHSTYPTRKLEGRRREQRKQSEGQPCRMGEHRKGNVCNFGNQG